MQSDEEIMRRGGGSPPASQLAELIWDSCHRGKLWQTKVPVQKQQTNKKQKKSPKGTKNIETGRTFVVSTKYIFVWLLFYTEY